MTEKDMRLTVGELKKRIKNCPDNAIVYCQSDEEGNRTMVCFDCWQEEVGKVENLTIQGKTMQFTQGEDVIGFDEEDKGLPYIVIRPLY